MNDDFDPGLEDLDRRLRSAARSGGDPAAVSRVRQSVARDVSAVEPRRGWRTLLFAGAAVLVPAAAAAAVAGIFLLGPGRNVAQLLPAGKGSPSAPASPVVVATPSPTPVPVVGFRPRAFSAINENHWWVLGCSTATGATQVVTTTDGGAHFRYAGSVPAEMWIETISRPASSSGS